MERTGRAAGTRSRGGAGTSPCITFLGAAGEVTGSCYLVETGAVRFLVDCGMFQGGRAAARRNREALAFDPASIDFVVLSHAHIDHSGLLPRLVALGFRGSIHATAATTDLARVMLPDSAYIQEREAQQSTADRRRSRGLRARDAAPLYTVAQAHECLKRFRGHAYDEPFEPAPGVRCVLRDAGHILGSATVELRIPGLAGPLVHSGDLGQPGHPIVRDATPVRSAEILLIESTYGNRCHRSMADTVDELVEAVTDTLSRRRGNLIVPAFAVGRTQDMLFLLADLHRQGRLPAMDVYVDSPMALAATEVTLRHVALFDREGRELLDWFRSGASGLRIRFVEDVEDSIALARIRSGAIIVSASGMCDAGRIKYHLRNNLGRPECGVLIVGFQAAGTLGRRLVDGHPRVRIFGEDVPVRARIHTVGGLSAHADRDALLAWLGGFDRPPRRTYVVHGEPLAAHALAAEIDRMPGWQATVPEHGRCDAMA